MDVVNVLYIAVEISSLEKEFQAFGHPPETELPGRVGSVSCEETEGVCTHFVTILASLWLKGP